MSMTFRCVGWLVLLMASAMSTAHAESAKVVRLAVVNTPQYSGLLDYLLPDFEAESGLTVEVYSGNDVHQQARAGKADLVISHYGRHEVESFVLEGYGSWPKIVFANQAVLIGPKSDPAEVRGLSSASEALRRIAKAKAPFIANGSRGMAYLTSILWEAAGRPSKDDWFVDTDRVNVATAVLAEEKKGGSAITGSSRKELRATGVCPLASRRVRGRNEGYTLPSAAPRTTGPGIP